MTDRPIFTLVAGTGFDAADHRFDEAFPRYDDRGELLTQPLRTMTADEVLETLVLSREQMEEAEEEAVAPGDIRRQVELVQDLLQATTRYARLLAAVFSTIPPSFDRIVPMDDAVRRCWPIFP